MKARFMMWSGVLALIAVTSLHAQSNPTPHNLSSGDYSLAAWDPTNSAGTYPPNVAFHIFNRADNNLQPDTAQVIGDYTGAYNGTSGTRINGLGIDGFAFLNTSSPGNLGAAVLAINTTGRVNIRVSWKAGTLASTFTGFRYYSIMLQYRVGTTGQWQTAIIGPDTVQYNANIQGTSVVAETVTMPTFTLPSSCENQSVVQLRWRYYQRYPQTSGNRPQLKVDDILVQSDASTGIPTKLAITTIAPVSPSRTAPFSVTIQAQNDLGQPRNVQSNTNIVLELANGSGTLGGSLTATIPAGTNSVTVSGVTYSIAESNVQIRVRRTAGDNLSNGVSAPFTVLPNATQLTVESFSQFAFAGLILPAFTVTARRSDGSIDTHFPYQCNIVIQSGPGTPSGTTSTMHINGVALFNNLSFATPGTYTIAFTANNITSVSYTLTIVAHPTVTEQIIPQYMLSSNASTRIPVWALVRLGNLQPNTTYRYYVGADSVSLVTATIGAGNNLHYNANNQTFNYTATRDFSVSGGYSEFRTGPAQTTMTLWVNLVATANVRFTEGNTMYWLITILDSNRAIQTRIVTVQGTKALYFGPATNKVSGMVDSASGLSPKSIICLYDDITGNSRPVATAIIQDEGTTVTSAVPFYAAVDSLAGAFATVVPNSIPAIRRIEVRDLQTGSLLRVFTDSDGIWGQADTRSPSSGINATSIHTPRIELRTSLAGQSLCLSGPLAVTVFIRGVDSARVELIRDNDPPFIVARGILPGISTLQLDIPANLAGSSNTYLRVIDNTRSDVYAVTGPFTLNMPPRVIAQSPNTSLCQGDSVTLVVLASGTNLRYQWEKDGQPLAGATTNQLHLSYVNARSSGIYRCRIYGSGTCSNDSSNFITIAVRPRLEITRHPGTVYAGLGKTAQLSIETSITDPHASYQWYRGSQPLLDNNRITGSRTATLTIRNVQQSDYGATYYCIVTTQCGTVTSDTGALRFTGIEFTFDTSPLEFCEGATATFSVTARSTTQGQLRYQWLRNGTPLQESARIRGTTTSQLVVADITTNDAGEYSCRITDESTGETRTTPARRLQLRERVTVLYRTSDSTYCFGDPISITIKLSVVATVRAEQNGAPVLERRTDSLTLRITNYDRSLSSVRFFIITECDSFYTNPTAISFYPAPVITTQPREQVQILEGTALVLGIEAQGSPGEQLRYRWYKDGEPLPDSIASGPVLTISNATINNRGQYVCVVYNHCGDSTRSNVARVDVISSVSVLDKTQIELYPQPVSETLTITHADDVRRIAVVDVLGRTLLELQIVSAPIAGDRVCLDVSSLPSGVYRLLIYRTSTFVQRQFVIQR
ncbi:MAG: immunoglobulin domain-containing protein [Chlorobi bacterium]|nr:immunoglobulin domain-containing protein [Chlorobiota bacterium]